MKMLLLNGHGIDVRVSGAKLHIKNGRTSTDQEPEEYVFSQSRRKNYQIWNNVMYFWVVLLYNENRMNTTQHKNY